MFMGHSIYDKDGKELCYVIEVNGRSYSYASKQAYDALIKDWEAKRDKCKGYAEKVIKCHDLEESTAVMVEIFSSSKNSVVLSQKQLTEASALTKAINEKNMTDAANAIDSLNTNMDDESTKCDEALEELDRVSEALKLAGEKYTELHNEAFRLYKDACLKVHKSVENFIGGA